MISGVDFGGTDGGAPILLVHGSGQNAAAWTDVAERLTAGGHRVFAADLRGHGQHPLGSTSGAQYWRDLADVVAELGWERPLLAGHSTGGYAVTAAVAAGLIDASGVCVVDGVVLDDRATAAAALAHWSTDEGARWMRETFRYGWVASAAERDAWLDAPLDELEQGARPGLVREVRRRSFVPVEDGFLRRPTTAEIATAGAPDPADDVFPAVDVYDRVRCPMTIVLASRGFYADRRDEVAAIVSARPDRHLVDLDANHNVPATAPAALAGVIERMVKDDR